MKITFQAFKWDAHCAAVTLADFLSVKNKYEIPDFGTDNYGKAIKHGRPIRRVYVYANEKGYYCGLVISIKNVRRFCTLTEDEEVSLLSTFQLSEKERMVDFNFFVIDSVKGVGLYQYYHNSCSLPTFNTMMRNQYYGYIADSKKKEIARLKSSGSKIPHPHDLAKKYKAQMTVSIFERKDAFEDKIRTMREIESITVSVVDVTQPAFSTIKSSIRRANLSYFMSKTDTIFNRVNAAITILSQYSPLRASATGLDAYGSDVTYKLDKDFDRFATFEYDNLASELNIDIKDAEISIRNNNIIALLKSKYEQIKHIIN